MVKMWLRPKMKRERKVSIISARKGANQIDEEGETTLADL